MPQPTKQQADTLREFGRKIKEQRLARRFTLKDVAKRADVSEAYISKIEGGSATIPSDGVLEALAKMLGFERDDLMRMLAPATVDERFARFVGPESRSRAEGYFPVVGIAAAGRLIEAVTDNRLPDGEIRVTAAWRDAVDELDTAAHIQAAFVVRAEGESMIPTIQPGDEVLIDPKAKLDPLAKPSQIALVRIGGEVTLKRWSVKKEKITLSSDNPSVKPFSLSTKEFAEKNGIAWKAVLTRTTRKLPK